jgi:hypothetical protein
VSVDFFVRFLPRVTTTFLTGALGAFGDLTTGSASCEGGSSTVGVSVAGAVANLFGSSSSLKRKQKVESFTQVDRKKEYMKIAAEHSRVQEVEKLYFSLWRRDLPDHSRMR